MKFIQFNHIDQESVKNYLELHKDKSIQEVFNFIKSIPVLKRSTEQHLVYTYIFTHRKKLGVK